ncbi:MAG: GNAT family N-acetyltransferase [Myxococcales bacterium]|nr:GNAT family N-acetyltransferase [Myxococcales bacterium]MCB9719074.1 GNAT family N-acetyltransferase [Myxococcales bacterium]
MRPLTTSASAATEPSFRVARADELAAILELEDEAGRMFAEAGLPPDLEGLPRAEVLEAIEAGTLWVIPDAEERLRAFALCQLKPDALHLRELDVHPDHMHQGLGRRLVDYACERAAERGLPRVTLTTFAEVPWNAPLYLRYGFEVLPPDRLPPWLAELRRHEDAGVLGRWPRIAMARAA